MKTKHFFSLLALMLALFIGCKKDSDQHLPETEPNSSGWGNYSSFDGEGSCLDEIEASLINNDQRQLATLIYDDLVQYESTLTGYGSPVFEATLTEAFDEGGSSYFNVVPLIDEGADSVKSLLFLGTENGIFHYVFYPKSKALANPSFSTDFDHEGEVFTLSNSDFLELFQQCECYLFCPNEGMGIQDRGPLCPWNWLYEQFKKIKRGFDYWMVTHGININFSGGSGIPGDYTITIWVGGGNNGSTNSSGTGSIGGNGGSTVWDFEDHQMLQQYLLDCEEAFAAQTGAGDGGNPGDPNDPTNSPEFLEECQQFRAITDCINLNPTEHIWLYYNPIIREKLGNFILMNGCGEPQTCGSSDETKAWQKGWLDYRRYINPNDPIEMRAYQQRYEAVCAKTSGTGMNSAEKVRFLNEMRGFEAEYFGEATLNLFGDLIQAAIDGNCYDNHLSESCVCETYVDSKLISLMLPQDPSAYEQLIEFIKSVKDACENRCYDYGIHADFINNWLYAIQQNPTSATTGEVYGIGIWAKSIKDQILARNLIAFGEHVLVAIDMAIWEFDILVAQRIFNSVPNSSRSWGMERMLTKLGNPVSSFSTFKYAEKFGINSYDDLVKIFNQLGWSRSQKGVQFHHLIEQRFASKVGSWIGSNTGKWDSIVLEIAEHQNFTTQWRNWIPYVNEAPGPLGVNTASAQLSHIQDAAREIYKDFPEILQALGL